MGSISRNVYRNSNVNVPKKPVEQKILKNSEYGYIPQKTVHEENPLGRMILQGHKSRTKKKRRK